MRSNKYQIVFKKSAFFGKWFEATSLSQKRFQRFSASQHDMLCLFCACQGTPHTAGATTRMVRWVTAIHLLMKKTCLGFGRRIAFQEPFPEDTVLTSAPMVNDQFFLPPTFFSEVISFPRNRFLFWYFFGAHLGAYGSSGRRRWVGATAIRNLFQLWSRIMILFFFWSVAHFDWFSLILCVPSIPPQPDPAAAICRQNSCIAKKP